jgi:hypothetical protein
MGRGRWLPWTRRCTRRRLPRSTLRSEACSAAWTCLAPPSRTKWTRRVLHPVLIGHAVFGCVDVPAPPRPHPLLAAWCAVSLRGRCVWAPETETSSQCLLRTKRGGGRSTESLSPTLCHSSCAVQVQEGHDSTLRVYPFTALQARPLKNKTAQRLPMLPHPGTGAVCPDTALGRSGRGPNRRG